MDRGLAVTAHRCRWRAHRAAGADQRRPRQGDRQPPGGAVSFLVGTIALAAIVVLSGKAGGLGSTFDVSWYYLLGGLLGAVYVANALVAVSAIGAGGVAAATVAGQLTASVAIDRLGLFGLDQVALSPSACSASACFWPAPSGRPLSAANSGGAIPR